MSGEKKYDIFLSYNSLDHAYVERVAEELKARQCSFFIDRWYLTPGQDWVEALERALQASRGVAVFLGPNEMGRWQQRERAWALDRAAGDENFPVIPVLLPGSEPPLGFLKQRMWIDLRDDPASKVQLDALAAAIRGERVDLAGELKPQAMICPYRGRWRSARKMQIFSSDARSTRTILSGLSPNTQWGDKRGQVQLLTSAA